MAQSGSGRGVGLTFSFWGEQRNKAAEPIGSYV